MEGHGGQIYRLFVLQLVEVYSDFRSLSWLVLHDELHQLVVLAGAPPLERGLSMLSCYVRLSSY